MRQKARIVSAILVLIVVCGIAISDAFAEDAPADSGTAPANTNTNTNTDAGTSSGSGSGSGSPAPADSAPAATPTDSGGGADTSVPASSAGGDSSAPDSAVPEASGSGGAVSGISPTPSDPANSAGASNPSDSAGTGSTAAPNPVSPGLNQPGEPNHNSPNTNQPNPIPGPIPGQDQGIPNPSPSPGIVQNPAPRPQPMPPKNDFREQIPENCKRVMMDNGIEQVMCGSKCPLPPPENEIQKCRDNKGVPQFVSDSRGCNVFECRYQPAGGGFGGNPQCPSEQQRSDVSEKCKSQGMRSIMRKDFSGCLVVDCVRENGNEEMRCLASEEDARIADNCKKNGGKVVAGFDPRGCRISLCEYNGNIPGAMQNSPESERYVRSGECKEIPKEAFEKCSADGGKLVVKRDERGCPTFADCIMRGDERSVEYEEVSEVPDSSALLSMAFKLETLKIEFDRLAKKTEDIANYYTSAGKSEDAQRFKKVSSMFEGAETRIDEIKAKMRDRMDAPTKEDMSEIKHDIKYIREVVMKDILYVMLNGEEAGYERGAGNAGSGETAVNSTDAGRSGMPFASSSAGISKNADGEINCKTDGFCFNEQMRVCEKALFYPPAEMRGKVEMHIIGLEDKNCVLKAKVTDEKTGAALADMTCKFPDYVMGLKGPEELMPYCKGSMADMFDKYGRGGSGGGPNGLDRNNQPNRGFNGGDQFEPTDEITEQEPIMPPLAQNRPQVQPGPRPAPAIQPRQMQPQPINQPAEKAPSEPFDSSESAGGFMSGMLIYPAVGNEYRPQLTSR